MTGRLEFVFGYGSLAARPQPIATREIHPRGFVAELSGARRTWGVAMDNRRDLPGYKYYTDAAGRRPGVFVAYLDLLPAEATVNGLCLPVDGTTLLELDRRERNYARVDVSDRVDAGGARVWVYVGTAAARRRLAQGRRTGTAVIDAGYVRAVEGAFRALGPDEHDACRPSLDPAGLPVVELVRHELP
jgi:gamma-glutamylcyclotransferase (GGCT)/AIG2-like uncharacterized protein YtfP